MSKWKIVNHPVIPGMVIIEGPAFRLVIATQAVDITSWNRRQILADARLIAAAPEMRELIQALACTWLDDCQFIPCDTEAATELRSKLAVLAAQANQLLGKVEGGGE